MGSIEQPIRKKDAQHMAAGALARCTASIIMCPFDTIKTRLQFQGSNQQQVKQYTGVADAFTKILQQEGIYGFTRGLGPRLAYIVPAAGVSFFCYEKIVSIFRNPEQHAHGYKSAIFPMIGISLARVLGTTIRTPFDVLKVRLQVQGYKFNNTILISSGSLKSGIQYKNSLQAIRSLWKTEGIRGAFGFVPVALLRDAPFAFLYFSLYEIFKSTQSYLFYDNSLSSLQAWNHFLAGAGAGGLAAVATIPFDVIKTRMQTQVALNTHKYDGIFTTFKTILKEEGLRGFTNGAFARVVYIMPASAIIFTSYEQYKKWIDFYFPNKNV